MIKFLFGTIEEFVAYEPIVYTPFGKGPWPCLNPFCKEYMKESIQEVHIKKGSTRGRTTGSWVCDECGFKYTRQGPDIQEQDRYRIGIVNEYGQVFDNKVREVCKDTSLELRELAKLLYCGDANTLRRHMKRVGIDPTLYSKGIAFDSEEVRIEKYKKRFMNKLELNPSITYKEISRIFGYKLLMEKAPEFCEKNFPKRKLVEVGTKEFEETDKKIAEAIRTIGEDVLLTNKNIYMTKNFFCKTIGYSGINSKEIIDKTVFIKKALEDYCESKDQYLERQTKSKDTLYEEQYNKYKRKMENYIEKNPTATVTEIRHLLGTEKFKLLKEADPEFCSRVLPKKKGVWLGTSEWKERDIRIAREIEVIGNLILKRNEDSRITRRLFRVRTGYYLIENRQMLDKMPVTKAILEKYCETQEQYATRKENGTID